MSEKQKSAAKKRYEGFSDEERDAMQQRVRELKVDRPDDEAAQLEKIAELPEPDRAMAKRLHAIMKANAPELKPKLWYGMPGYARDGKIVCFFQSSHKFKTRYATLGFNDSAHLDEGNMWPVAYALKKLTAAEEARIVALVKQAASPVPAASRK